MSVERPKGAPYTAVEPGEPIEIEVFQDDTRLIAEFVYRGDTFGSSVDLSEYDGGVSETIAVDELVAGVAALAYNELLLAPYFRDEDEKWTVRVDAQRPWEAKPPLPTQGWIAADDLSRYEQAETIPDVPPRPSDRDPVADSIGDADVADLRLTQDEMAALTRGELPESLLEKVMSARSTGNLLASVADLLTSLASDQPDDAEVVRALREIREVRRRFGQ